MLVSSSRSLIILLYPRRSPTACLFCIGVAWRTSTISNKMMHTCGCMYKARKNRSHIAQRKKKQPQDPLASPSGAAASGAEKMTKPPFSLVVALISKHAPCIFDTRVLADVMLVAALVGSVCGTPWNALPRICKPPRSFTSPRRRRRVHLHHQRLALRRPFRLRYHAPASDHTVLPVRHARLPENQRLFCHPLRRLLLQ